MTVNECSKSGKKRSFHLLYNTLRTISSVYSLVVGFIRVNMNREAYREVEMEGCVKGDKGEGFIRW